jgi:hypothetical protein
LAMLGPLAERIGFHISDKAQIDVAD